ncbi:MAG: GNAT family N-acetyltransferase [Proteobacteria bacterium]|nr:GNAT family N-acetyltransferase [Pseudomonadota bacterium]
MVEIILNPSIRAWDDYVVAKSDATFSHRFFWGESLADAYRLPVFRLGAQPCSGDKALVGILSLMLFAAPGMDLRLISLPYTDGAGIVADDEEIRRKLLDAGLDLAIELGAVHIELRQGGNINFHEFAMGVDPCWCHTAHTFKTGLNRPLPESSEQLWASLPAKVRNQVRKARKCGCTVAVGGLERVDDFYAVFSENMRDLGSPVHDFQLVQLVVSEPSLGPRVLVVFLAEKPVAAAIVFTHNAVLCNPWASSLRSCRPSCPNMLLYWAMLELAVVRGCRWFDFGRSSPDATTRRFKSQWGAIMQPLTWHVFSRKPHNWDPYAETLVDEAWKLLDLATSRRDGPARRRWISL